MRSSLSIHVVISLLPVLIALRPHRTAINANSCVVECCARDECSINAASIRLGQAAFTDDGSLQRHVSGMRVA